ncbi:hypothetical protein RB195_013496 [Necator americanus]|uniref:CHK kinase-like domain-containing protein n=1 Tax=Necator americanus TaxID=51031 RepID=A0ABR1DXB0_NECAM
MNLYTPSNGLFETHVTWKDVEEDMQRAFETEAFFGPCKSATNIGEGNGYLSRIVLIEPDWQQKDRELPERFIVCQLAMKKFTAELTEGTNVEDCFGSSKFAITWENVQKRLHNAEVTIYDYLKKLPKGEIPCGEFYFARKFSENNPLKGYLGMEYLDNTKPVHLFENVPLKAIKQILRAVASLQALSLNFTPEEKNRFTTTPFTEMFAHFYTDEVTESFMKMFRDFEDGTFAEKVDKLQEIIPDLMDLSAMDQLPDEMGMERVLCHGDMWSMNILWRESGKDLNVAAVIDFQASHMGCAATDLARLFASCLSGKDRREHWEELAEEFYEFLKERIGDKKMPYTLEQLKESYRRAFPLFAFMIVPFVGTLFESQCRDSEKEKFLDIAKEKIECLLDDLLDLHERNVKLKKTKST